MSTSAATPASTTTQLAAISRAVKSGVRLTRQLLSFSRKQALKPEVVVLQQWLPAVGDLLRTTIGRAIELEIEIAPQIAAIQVDPTELELALINIAVNAKHAMPSGGTLRICAARSRRAGAMVVIAVSDSGTGIAPDVLDKVFDPFFSTKQPGEGSGLGLSQVYGLCAQAGGSATIASTVGRGTTVTLQLPAVAVPAPVLPPVAPPQPARLRGHVLLVEDNEQVADGIVALLRSAGLEVSRAVDADAGLALGLAGAFDVVLSDIAMPGAMSGIDLALRLRQAKPSLPVLLMTGYSARIHEAAAAGLRVLSKPTEPSVLLAEIGVALRRVQAAGKPERALS